MTYPQDTPRHTESAAEAGTPRSSVWQGFLGMASVVAYALLFELARNLVLNSFGEQGAIKVLAGTLRWLSVLLVLAAAVYALYRFTAGVRERNRAAQELDLIADLVEPGPLVGAAPAPPRPPELVEMPSLNGDRIAAVLRELPTHAYDTATLLDVLTALLEEPARLPSTDAPPHHTARTLLDDLLRREVLKVAGAQRYVLHGVPQLRVRETVLSGLLWQAALPALLRHRAGRAARWAVALESVRFAAGARRWFETEEPALRQMIAACAALSAAVPTAAAPDLARIGDALDVWYARIGIAEDGSGLAADLCAVPSLRSLVLHRDLAMMRAGLLDARPAGYRPRRLSNSLTARWEHRAALAQLHRPSRDPEAAARLEAVERQLESAWWLLPREDVAGQVCALINLVIVQLRQGRLDAAGDRLELAASLTRGGRDPGGRAHTHEILGVLWWIRGEPPRALRYWQLALTAYRTLADDLGIGRCLQHLGSAVVVAPDYGGILLGADPPLTRAEVLRQAGGWLIEARRRYPAAHHAEHYAREANPTPGNRLRPGGRPQALRRIDRWPLPVADPAAEQQSR